LSDSPELLKPNVEVTDSELQIELGNSKIENETLKPDYAKLLESSTHVTNKLRQEVQELRSQLETERADREEIEAELSPAKAKFCSGRHSFRKINTRRDNNSQPARPPAVKNQKPSSRTWKPS
jgi:predicted  nucleic acid-binding Zn-ribbon protein